MPEQSGAIQIRYVAVEKFYPNPYQPLSRVEVTPETREYYGKSILEHGLLQIPLAREAPYGKKGEKYEMGDGWLRLQGYKWLSEQGHKGYEEIPVEIRSLDDEHMAHLVFEANGVRKDLEPIEKAKFFKRYLDEFKVSEKKLAEKLSISQGEISNTLRLLQLPEEIQKEVATGKVPQTHARELVRLKNKPEKQKAITQEVIKGGVSVKELSKKIDAEMNPAVGQLTHGPEKNEDDGKLAGGELPCVTCGSSKECERTNFYVSNTGEYLCDRKTPMKDTSETVVIESVAETVPVETTVPPSNPVLTSILCDADYIGNFVTINSCQSLTEKPPKFKGLSKWEDSIYACTGTVLKGDKVLEADCYQVMEFVGNLRWGSYKGKNYVLVGSPVKFIPKAVKNEKAKPKKK
jgi:ParB family chromosome partitioning protein